MLAAAATIAVLLALMVGLLAVPFVVVVDAERVERFYIRWRLAEAGRLVSGTSVTIDNLVIEPIEQTAVRVEQVGSRVVGLAQVAGDSRGPVAGWDVQARCRRQRVGS
jgi:hypothetical protein